MLFNNKKKVVLVIDHKDRDLRGIALVAFWLNSKWGIMPYITHTRNEISCLIKHKPDLIVTPHVTHQWQEEFFQYAKAQNTVIALFPGEGFPYNPYDNNMFYRVLNYEMYAKYVDVIISWGSIFVDSMQNNKFIKNKDVQIVGVPRFDYYNNKYSGLNMSRNELCEKLSIDNKQPIVLWLTSTCYANHESGIDELIKNVTSKNSSAYRAVHILPGIIRDHQKVFNDSISLFNRLVTEYPNINIIIKIHPAENMKPYYDMFHDCSNVKIITDVKIPLAALLKNTDIQINWRCTTSAEGWLCDINKPVISFDIKVERNELRYIDDGNDIVADYLSFRNKINYYLDGGEVSQDLIMTRKSFINNFLTSSDGNSAERCVDAINKYISDRKPPQRSIYNYKQIIRYMKKYRFNPNWLASKRDEKHEKYIPSELIHDEMKRLINHFKKDVEYIVEL